MKNPLIFAAIIFSCNLSAQTDTSKLNIATQGTSSDPHMVQAPYIDRHSYFAALVRDTVPYKEIRILELKDTQYLYDLLKRKLEQEYFLIPKNRLYNPFYYNPEIIDPGFYKVQPQYVPIDTWPPTTDTIWGIRKNPPFGWDHDMDPGFHHYYPADTVFSHVFIHGGDDGYIYGKLDGEFKPLIEHSHIPYDTVHYDVVNIKLRPDLNGNIIYVKAYNVFYIPELKLWLTKKKKPMLRGRYAGAEVFKLVKVN